MAQFPPGFRPSAPPPPTFWFPPSLPLSPPPSRSSDSRGRVIAAVVIGVAVSVLLCSLCKCRSNRARAAAAVPDAGPQPPTETIDEQPLRPASPASPTAGLPAFTFSPSTKRNVTGLGEEAATCSVCLGALQIGERVRLLPVCLHLYHAECIDPWLDEHSTCPNCRAETDDPTTGVDHV